MPGGHRHEGLLSSEALLPLAACCPCWPCPCAWSCHNAGLLPHRHQGLRSHGRLPPEGRVNTPCPAGRPHLAPDTCPPDATARRELEMASLTARSGCLGGAAQAQRRERRVCVQSSRCAPRSHRAPDGVDLAQSHDHVRVVSGRLAAVRSLRAGRCVRAAAAVGRALVLKPSPRCRCCGRRLPQSGLWTPPSSERRCVLLACTPRVAAGDTDGGDVMCAGQCIGAVRHLIRLRHRLVAPVRAIREGPT